MLAAAVASCKPSRYCFATYCLATKCWGRWSILALANIAKCFPCAWFAVCRVPRVQGAQHVTWEVHDAMCTAHECTVRVRSAQCAKLPSHRAVSQTHGRMKGCSLSCTHANDKRCCAASDSYVQRLMACDPGRKP